MKHYCRYIIIVVFAFLTPHAKGQEQEPISFSTISIKEGLSQLSVTKIYQDCRGYMWFATRNGLNRYDGKTFKVYKQSMHDPHSGLTDNHIYSIAEDKSHYLWVGSTRGISVINLITDKAFPVTKLNKITAISNGVNALCTDKDNNIWIGTSYGLFTYNNTNGNFKSIYIKDLGTKDLYVSALKTLNDNRIAIGTNMAGIFVYNPQKKTIIHYHKNSKKYPLSSNNISAIYQDNDNNVWVATKDNGFNKIEKKSGKITFFTKENSVLTTNNIRDIIQMNNHMLIGTFEGLYTLSLDNNELSKLSNEQTLHGQLSHFSIYALFLDKHEGLWVGTYSGGVNYYSKFKDRFTLHSSPKQSVCGPVIHFNDQTYVATEGSGLMEYDLKTDHYTCFLYNTSSRLHSRNIIKSLSKNDQTIWCGTTDGELYSFNPKSKSFDLYFTMNLPASVYAIHQNNDNSFWLVTSNNQRGLLYISPNKEAKTVFRLKDNSQFYFPSLRCMLALNDSLLLLGSRNNGLYKYDVRKGEITHYQNAMKGSHHMPSDYVTSIIKDQKGKIWITTFGGGLCRYDTEKGIIKTISMQDGLSSDELCMVVNDDQGKLWLSSTHCISSVNPESGEIHNYQGYPISALEFTPHTGIQLDNGTVCFSANNGFISFNPNHMETNQSAPSIIFNELSVNNQRIEPHKNGILEKVLDETQKIKLKYNQNNIIISYCAINFSDPDLCQYAYRLKGHDNSWNYVGNRQEAYFTNLSPGKYTFLLKATNNDGIWGKDIRELQIVLTPPIWDTWYAHLFYLLLISAIGYIILSFYNRERRLKLEQKEQQQREQFNQEKISMFTNLFHELRTPLQLIISPVEELGKHDSLDLNVRNKLDLIYNNSQRLLLLVNQMMDLRKSQTGKLRLKIRQDDIYSFIQESFIAFKQLATDKNITLTFSQENQHLQAWYDKFMFEKVLFNLLSNAIKNTPNGGHIQIIANSIEKNALDEETKKTLNTVPDSEKMLVLEVIDDGRGIPEEELTRIFEPFYQATNNNKTKEAGTGIGLSLTRSIIELHHGIIKAFNNKDGGAHFWLTIPIDKDLYKPEDMDASVKDQIMTDVLPSKLKKEELNIEKKYTVLLVEDNDEVRKYIANCLDPYFFVIEASDGKSGLDKASDKLPDIIVSDVMMPKMDGLELCKRIKEDMLIGHIPVILMTAKSMTVHIIEGYTMGADDYIIKPFNIDVLIYRIKNIIDARIKLKEKYGKTFSPEALGIDTAEGSDRFIQKFFSVIEANLSNSDLNVDYICQEIGVSRTNLYRKMKNVTDLSPIELIRNKRLEVAAQLLQDTDFSIFDIAVQTGFNSQAYFSKCFKAVYGCAPSEYAETNKKK